MVDRLRELQASSPDIEASAVVSVDGLSIASALPQGIEEDRVSAMSAAMLSLGERIASELGRGTLEQVYIKGEKGYVVLMSVGEEAVLTALAREQAKLGPVTAPLVSSDNSASITSFAGCLPFKNPLELEVSRVRMSGRSTDASDEARSGEFPSPSSDARTASP